MRLPPFIRVAALCSLLVSCSGYQLGGQKPSRLASIYSIYTPLAKNEAFIPRAEALLTNSTISRLAQDGTYQVGTLESAQARLDLRLLELTYRAIRSGQRNTLRPEELELTARVSWQLLDLRNRTTLEEGIAQGRTRFFVDENLQTARRNALPDAFQEVANRIVLRLADGF